MMFLGSADIHSLTLAVYFSMSLSETDKIQIIWKAPVCGCDPKRDAKIARKRVRCHSLQGGDVVVINEHPFNTVVEELGVVAFLTWKQKTIQILAFDKMPFSTCD